jgi:hypothetical protein
MLDECPFCGGRKSSPYALEFRYGTTGLQHLSQITWRRSHRCYEAQIAALSAELDHISECNRDLTDENMYLLAEITALRQGLRDAVEVVRAASIKQTAITHVMACECQHCRKVRQARILLPTLEKLAEIPEPKAGEG